MKEATGELNMTLVTIIAIAAVLTFVTAFLPNILDSIGSRWDEGTNTADNQINSTNGANYGNKKN
ncbi:MAG: hypothetical protein IJ568_01810 [Bacilli bacterium]|nr:hypothetical protein [Bacilli bacterium]